MHRLGLCGVRRLEQLDRRRFGQARRGLGGRAGLRRGHANRSQRLRSRWGTLRFSRSTALLAALKLDDVLVSEPSAAAPSGFLRKVKSIRLDGSGVVLETTQASLTDVITQGDLSAETELGLDDSPT